MATRSDYFVACNDCLQWHRYGTICDHTRSARITRNEPDQRHILKIQFYTHWHSIQNITYSFGLNTDIREWMDEQNIEYYLEMAEHQYTIQYDVENGYFCNIVFSNVTDMIAFKLRWL